MKIKLNFLLLFTFVFSAINAQNNGINEFQNQSNLVENVRLLDLYMKDNNSKIEEILHADVSFGHSNGWVQNFEDFKKDFESKKVSYRSIEQTDFLEFKKTKNVASLRRKVKVSGIYKIYDFEMTLSLLEIWIKKGKTWKLWSRQATEIKE